MVRNVKFDHNLVVTGENDGTKQVSLNAWNDGHDETGMFGHGIVTTLTIATGAITPVNDMHKLNGEGAIADDLATIINTETAEFDELWVLSGAQTITLVNSGNIVTLTGLDTVISTTVPTKLIRVGTSWYEVGASGGGVFPDTSFAIQDDGDITKQMLVQLSGATSTFDTTLAFTQTADRTVTFPDATTTLAGLGVAQAFTLDNTFANIIHTGRHQYDKGVDVASADAPTLGGDGNVFDITGTTTINHIQNTGWQVGSKITLHFVGAVLLNHATGAEAGDEASLYLSGDTNYTTSAGDVLEFVLLELTQWQEVSRNTTGSEITTWTANHSAGGFDLTNIQNLIHDLSTTTVELDFAGDEFQEISISANTTFTGTGYAIGKSKTVIITTDATLRTLAFPAGWKFLNNSKPTDQSLSTKGVLTLTCQTGAEAGVIATYASESGALGLENVIEDPTPQLGGTLDCNLFDIDNIQNLAHNISVTTVALDFALDEIQTITVSATATFTCATYIAGKSKTIKILDSGSGQTLAFPATWVFLGTKPTAIVASKTGVLSLTCFSTTEDSVVASYEEEA